MSGPTIFGTFKAIATAQKIDPNIGRPVKTTKKIIHFPKPKGKFAKWVQAKPQSYRNRQKGGKNMPINFLNPNLANAGKNIGKIFKKPDEKPETYLHRIKPSYKNRPPKKELPDRDDDR